MNDTTSPPRADTPATPAGAGQAGGRHLSHWLLNVPFILLHLALVAVFFVEVSWAAVGLCAFNYFSGVIDGLRDRNAPDCREAGIDVAGLARIHLGAVRETTGNDPGEAE